MMITNKYLSRALLWVLSCSAALSAVSLTAAETAAQAGKSKSGFEVKLTSKSEIVTPTDSLVLVLSLHV